MIRFKRIILKAEFNKIFVLVFCRFRHVLSERLKRLVENDILIKFFYVQRQERYEYQFD